MADSFFFSAGKIVLMKNLILENDIARKREAAGKPWQVYE